MPQDYRRFNGPEGSTPYQSFIKAKKFDETYGELLNGDGRRKDGRKPEEGRAMCKKLYARVDMVSQAKGSSYVELKRTKVVCSVFDPREIPHQNEFSQEGQLYCEIKFAPFSCKGERRSPVPDAEERALSVALRQALEPAVCRNLFPNYQIDIFVYILENDGSCLAAAINAAGLALVNAAVPMYDIVSASTLAYIGDKVFIDPTYEEELIATNSFNSKENHGVITMSTILQLKQVTDFRLVGSLDMSRVTEAMELLENECKELVPLFQQLIVCNVTYYHNLQMKIEAENKVREQLLNEKMDEWKSQLNAG